MNANPTTYPDGSVLIWEQNGQYMELADENYYGCKNGQAVNGRVRMGYTVTWNPSTRPQMIRICPLLLSQIAAQRFWDVSQISPE